jgi:hypothetical protein
MTAPQSPPTSGERYYAAHRGEVHFMTGPYQMGLVGKAATFEDAEKFAAALESLAHRVAPSAPEPSEREITPEDLGFLNQLATDLNDFGGRTIIADRLRQIVGKFAALPARGTAEPEYRCIACREPIPDASLRMGEFYHCQTCGMDPDLRAARSPAEPDQGGS